ncbi:hypothetical protein [Paraburkholderia aromaticivorans]|uniref:hypothetical protein n=1 Tax=Paraburkholderia aromaticivorans TaxID=2026199 RepID=UPI001455F27A|nr:hypothetical protein [Paraburkholderia aromaticivorans]
MRDALKQAQLDQLTNGDWQASLKALNAAYDDFVAKHGNILDYSTITRTDDEGNTTETKRFKNDPLLRLDVDGPLAYSLEHITSEGDIIKAPVLSERVLEHRRSMIHVTGPKFDANVTEWLACTALISRRETGTVTGEATKRRLESPMHHEAPSFLAASMRHRLRPSAVSSSHPVSAD